MWVGPCPPFGVDGFLVDHDADDRVVTRHLVVRPHQHLLHDGTQSRAPSHTEEDKQRHKLCVRGQELVVPVSNKCPV